MKYFVENGGYVATCLFRQGEFVFEITNKLEELINFSGSKYVKSNPLGIYAKVIEKLKYNIFYRKKYCKKLVDNTDNKKLSTSCMDLKIVIFFIYK